MEASAAGSDGEECAIGMSMVGRVWVSEASCAAFGDSVGGYIAIGAYSGTSIEDMDDEGSDDGRTA